MKKELTISESNQVCGGKFEGEHAYDAIVLMVSVCEYDHEPTHDAMYNRLQEMIYDDHPWTLETATAELQAIEPKFQPAV